MTNVLGRIGLAVAVLGLIVGSAGPARAGLVTSNIGNPDAGFFSGFDADSVAASSFTTDAAGGVLESATLMLFSQFSPSPAEFVLRLYNNNVDRPGSAIATFTNTPSTSNPGSDPEGLTFFAHEHLEPDTTYWLGVTVTGSASGGWSQVTGPSTGSWTIGGLNFSFDGGQTWGSTGTRANEFSLNATIASVPEPSTLAGGLLGVALAGGGVWLRRVAGAERAFKRAPGE